MMRKTPHAEATAVVPRVGRFEAWLWRRGFHHPVVRYLLLWQLRFLIVGVVVGCAALPWTQDGLVFCLGIGIFSHIFWGVSSHIMGMPLNQYSGALLALLLMRSGFRLGIIALAVYLAFVVFDASAVVLLGGMTASMALALGTFALKIFVGHKQ